MTYELQKKKKLHRIANEMQPQMNESKRIDQLLPTLRTEVVKESRGMYLNTSLEKMITVVESVCITMEN
jgi:hypothetical protein